VRFIEKFGLDEECMIQLKQQSPSVVAASAARYATSIHSERHQSQPNAISAIPAMQNDSRYHQVPRLPYKVKVDVTKCHACHAKSRGVHGVIWEPGAPPEPAPCHQYHACHALQF